MNKTHIKDLLRDSGFNPMAGLNHPRNKSRKFHSGPQKRRAIELLIQRDGLNCCWCKQECIPTANPSADLFPTVEHVIRLADGGTNRMENLKVACKKCNNERHGKGPLPPRILGPHFRVLSGATNIEVELDGVSKPTQLYKKRNGRRVFWCPFTGDRVLVGADVTGVVLAEMRLCPATMKLIETFCQRCRDPIDIQIADEDYHEDAARLLAKCGCICARCRPINPQQPQSKRETTSPHNDP